MTDEFFKIDYERKPISPPDFTIGALVKWAINSKNCFDHYGGKHSIQKCKNKEMIIAFAEFGNEPNVAKLLEELQVNLETLDDVLGDK